MVTRWSQTLSLGLVLLSGWMDRLGYWLRLVERKESSHCIVSLRHRVTPCPPIPRRLAENGPGVVSISMLSSLDDVLILAGAALTATPLPSLHTHIFPSHSVASPWLSSESVSQSCPYPHLQGRRTHQQICSSLDPPSTSSPPCNSAEPPEDE